MIQRYIITILTIVICFTGCGRKSANAYLNEAGELQKKENYKEAINLLNKAIEKNSKLKEAYIQRGLCYESLQQHEKAIKDYSTLLTFDPNNTAALFYTGICKYEQNKFNEAIDFYTSALVTKGLPSSPDTSSHFIIIYNENLKAFSDQISFDVASGDLFYDRGLAYYSSHQIKKAFYDFESCISQNYYVGKSNYMIGLCWLAADKKDKACNAFRDGAFYGDSLSIEQEKQVCK